MKQGLLAAALSACSTGPGAPAPPASPEPPDPRIQALLAADRRDLAAVRRLGGASPVAVTALARLRDPAAIPDLLRALRSADPAVRSAASLGLGTLEELADPSVEPALAAAVAVEVESSVRADLVRDLGRVGDAGAVAALEVALRDPDAAVRGAACAALGALRVRGVSGGEGLITLAGAALEADAEPRVRLACAFALSRGRPIPDGSGVRERLGRGAADPDGEVRVMAVRALAAQGAPPTAFAGPLGDDDWRVRVHAFRGLAKTGAPADVAGALVQVLERARARGLRRAGETHVVLDAAFAARRVASAQEVLDVAGLAHREAGALAASASRDQGLVHCALAALVDHGRAWPNHVTTCGMNQVSLSERDLLAVEVLEAAVAGAAEERVAYLARLYRSDDRVVRGAALRAAAAIEHAAADPILVEGLAATDLPVLGPALEAVAIRAGRSPFRAPDGGLARAFDRLSARDDLEGLQSWIAAAEATALDGELGRVELLAQHANPAVRLRARAALARAGRAAPPSAAPPPARPIDAAALRLGPSRVVLETTRGAVEIELDVVEAPATAARFAELVRAGAYDDTVFHRVVPGFVAQGGDPTGTGYGGPGWSQRCEDNRRSYGRGTVGMALAGRDTGGSQFFITHAAQPHLDGRYTAFGRVTAGMDAVDALQVGDRIVTARLVP